MNTKDFDYNLPKQLIAQWPANPRDHSRLLVLNRKNNQIKHDKFFNIIKYLKKGDLLVLNDSKVFPARLKGIKEATYGKVEILLNHQVEDGIWQCIGKNLKVNTRIKFNNSKLKAIILDKINDIYNIKFSISGENFYSELNKIGLTPLPPYIKKNVKLPHRQSPERRCQMSDVKDRDEESNRKQYQTVYAKEIGSVAAPTAGLHFTKELIKKIQKKGIEIKYLTLHVGLGTFAPIKSDRIENHKIHREYYSVDQKTINNIIKARLEHRRVIAVGTTTTRVLETLFEKIQIISHKSTTKLKFKNRNFNQFNNLTIKQFNNSLSGWTNIFIYPGYKFKCVDGLITNFHLPKSTLLMLVSAFADYKNINCAYNEAIKLKYSFYSYGDAMLIT